MSEKATSGWGWGQGWTLWGPVHLGQSLGSEFRGPGMSQAGWCPPLFYLHQDLETWSFPGEGRGLPGAAGARIPHWGISHNTGLAQIGQCVLNEPPPPACSVPRGTPRASPSTLVPREVAPAQVCLVRALEPSKGQVTAWECPRPIMMEPVLPRTEDSPQGQSQEGNLPTEAPPNGPRLLAT